MKSKWIVASILIVALLGLCGAMIASLWYTRGALTGGEGVSFEFFQEASSKAEADEEKTFDISGPLELTVNSDGGDIHIASGGTGQVKVALHKTAWASSEEKASTELKEMDIRIRQEGSRVIVEYLRPETITVAGSSQPNTVDFTITVPAETSVNAGTSFGELSLQGTSGPAELAGDFGSISVKDVSGAVRVKSSSGDIKAESIQAGEGEISLASDFGDISLTRSKAGAVNLDSNSGAISLADVQASGKVAITLDFGNLSFVGGSAERLSVAASSGRISLQGLTLKQGLEVDNDFGDLTLKDVKAAAYALKTNSGAIQVDGASGSLEAESGYGSLTITDARDVTLDLSTNSGTITFSGSLGEGPHKVNSDYGSIELSLPGDSRLSLELKTDFGRVQSELPVTIQGSLEDENMTGMLNGGGESLTVTTNSGDIRIKILK